MNMSLNNNNHFRFFFHFFFISCSDDLLPMKIKYVRRRHFFFSSLLSLCINSSSCGICFVLFFSVLFYFIFIYYFFSLFILLLLFFIAFISSSFYCYFICSCSPKPHSENDALNTLDERRRAFKKKRLRSFFFSNDELACISCYLQYKNPTATKNQLYQKQQSRIKREMKEKCRNKRIPKHSVIKI